MVVTTFCFFVLVFTVINFLIDFLFLTVVIFLIVVIFLVCLILVIVVIVVVAFVVVRPLLWGCKAKREKEEAAREIEERKAADALKELLKREQEGEKKEKRRCEVEAITQVSCWWWWWWWWWWRW